MSAQPKLVTLLDREDCINRANAMIYLLTTALSYELAMADQHDPRKESTNCGLSVLEAELRDSLAGLR